MRELASTSDGAIGQDDPARTTVTAAFDVVRNDAENTVFEPIASDAWDAPGWREEAPEDHKPRDRRVPIAPYAPEHLARLHRLMVDTVSLDRAWHELNRRAS